ncbi:hypothetical protein LTR56_005258 [Elasticomyces elasticus]|nr:hypothetical protein LTR56_005258 [Elasticomyces elasticus]KAK3656474.1 hypothetical protein LTR22_009747 [Elasticomyces elasticus]KAK4923634.1 hypothetical protein LTR49_009189 [Elasticomyces elasticus]KAK5762079.1 hypothetical protein LTS12_007776 [Elasticomyces elasticus]
MAPQAETNISGLREQIKGKPIVPFTRDSTSNAVMLFKETTKRYRENHPNAAATDAYEVVVTYQSVGTTYRAVIVAWVHDVLEVAQKGGFAQTGEGALRALLKSTGSNLDHNAILMYPNRVSNYQDGDKRVPAAEAFTVVVTKLPAGIPLQGFYRAFLTYRDRTFKQVLACGGLKSNAVEALHSLLDLLAMALSADLEGKVDVYTDRGIKWGERGAGEVMERDVELKRHGGGGNDGEGEY